MVTSERLKEINRKASKKYYNTSKGRISQRSKVLKSRYGITIEQYEEMLLAQNNLCPICLVSLSSSRICVDHCHKTKIVRGILHSNCNTLLGMAGDNPVSLERAAAYLRRFT